MVEQQGCYFGAQHLMRGIGNQADVGKLKLVEQKQLPLRFAVVGLAKQLPRPQVNFSV